MTYAMLEPLRSGVNVERVLGIFPAPVPVAAGLRLVDISQVTPRPEVHWLTSDGGKSFTDPMVQPLSTVQTSQSNQLRAACKTAIAGGFQSSALGSIHTYPADDASQRNLQAARGSSANPLLLMCADASAKWDLQPHTGAQVEQVNSDWVAFRQDQQKRLIDLISQVEAAKSVSDVQKIIW